MAMLAGDALALDFELADVRGETIRLSQFKGERNVVLVFLRGFL
jgi:peroxiredoxin